MKIYDIIGIGCITLELVIYIAGKRILRQELEKIDGFKGIIPPQI